MKHSLKTKFITILSCTIVIVLTMFCISMYTYNVLIARLEDYSVSLSQLNEFRYKFGQFNELVPEYLETSSSDTLEECQNISQDLVQLCIKIDDNYSKTDDETISSLVTAITSNYTTYLQQVQTLIDMQDHQKALTQYNEKYIKNSVYITEYIEKLTNQVYKVSGNSLEVTTSTVDVFKVINVVMFVVLAVVIAIIFRIVFSNVVRPITKLARQSQQIANYNFDVEDLDVNTKDEVAFLIRMFNHMKEKLKLMFNSNIKNLQMTEELLVHIQNNPDLEEFVRSQRSFNEEMFREANIDHLTNLMNKNAFVHCIDENLKEIDANELCSIFAIKIDDFSTLNKTLEEDADELLKIVANRMSNIFKDYGFISRYSKDIFMGYISGLPNTEFAKQLSNEINTNLNISFKPKKKAYPITVSVGTVVFKNHTNATLMTSSAEQKVSRTTAINRVSVTEE